VLSVTTRYAYSYIQASDSRLHTVPYPVYKLAHVTFSARWGEATLLLPLLAESAECIVPSRKWSETVIRIVWLFPSTFLTDQNNELVKEFRIAQR
jgi:hypothetical protein